RRGDKNTRFDGHFRHLPGDELFAEEEAADFSFELRFVDGAQPAIVVKVAGEDFAIELRNRQHPCSYRCCLASGVSISCFEELAKPMGHDGDDYASDERDHHTSYLSE